MIVDNLTGADLAFIGDAYYELKIRELAISKGITTLYKLHDFSVKYVSRDAQCYIVNNLMDSLNEKELDIFKRGRNYNYKTKTKEYIYASGFEAVIGYLYLTKNLERLDEIINKSIDIIGGKDD